MTDTPQQPEHWPLQLTAGETRLLVYIFEMLLRGGNPQMALRHKEYTALARKIFALKEKEPDPK